MVYSEELKIRDAQLSLTEHDNLELLLDDYLALDEMMKSCEKDIEPLEKQIIRLRRKVSLLKKVIHELKWEFWIKHLKDFDDKFGFGRKFQMNEFIKSDFSAIENEIRKLAFKKEEEK
jgi:predicted RNase H-like nuclease (RuvC/YqgF family)|tara:strand:+ start:1168 stop:1521 length:354 start_codon:yes stop_codon:yes gene_type:complete